MGVGSSHEKCPFLVAWLHCVNSYEMWCMCIVEWWHNSSTAFLDVHSILSGVARGGGGQKGQLPPPLFQ